MARSAGPEAEREAEEKSIALDSILEAWDRALSRGVSPEILASTAIFAALTDLVDLYGQEAVADMCANLPGRVRAGEFTFEDEKSPEGDAPEPKDE